MPDDVVSIADRVPELARERERATQDAARAAASSPATPPPAAAGGTTITLQVDATSAKDVEAALACMLNPVLKRKGIEPLDAEELKRGGEALAPAANRYLPVLLREHPELCLAFMFTFGVAVRRLPDETPPEPDDDQDDDHEGEQE